MSDSSKEKEVLSSIILENLQEQDDEMTVLTEIIGDSQMFQKIDFASELTFSVQNASSQYTAVNSISELEEHSASVFFTNQKHNYIHKEQTCRTSEIISNSYRYGGIMRVCPDIEYFRNTDVNASDGINITCRTMLNSKGDSSDTEKKCDLSSSFGVNYPKFEKSVDFNVKYLSPIVLNFALPETYPSKNPPNFNLYCTWLDSKQITNLKEKLIELWSENIGSVILFMWKSFLQEDSFMFLNLFDTKYSENTVASTSTNIDPNVFLDITSAVQEEVIKRRNFLLHLNDNQSTVSRPSKISSGNCATELIECPVESTTSAQINENPPTESTSCGKNPNCEITKDDTPDNDIKTTHESGINIKNVGHHVQTKIDEKFYGIIDRYFDRKGYGFIRVFGDGLKRVSVKDIYSDVSKRDSQTSKKLEKKKLPKCDTDSDVFWWDVYFHRTGLSNSKDYVKKGIEVEFTLTDDEHNKRKTTEDREKDMSQSSDKSTHNVRTKANNIKVLPLKHTQINLPTVNNPDKSNEKEDKVIDSGKEDEENASTNCDKMPNNESKSKYDRDKEDMNFILMIIKYLKECSELEEEKLFNSNSFLCEVCFMEKIGDQCMKFSPCNHIYCCDCMKAYFQVQIGEGMMNNLFCPSDGCQFKALPTQIRKLVSGAQYELYEQQLLSTTLETMSDVALCPRIKCQCPTLIIRERNMGHCPKCEYAFCIYCRGGYHGFESCRMNTKEKRQFIQEYMTADENKKSEMEKKYGGAKLRLMANQLLDDQYLKDNAKKCPNCNAYIQKIEGCNKMTCSKCNAFFCYLCESRLTKDNPYRHFGEKGTRCYNRLFVGAYDRYVDDDDPGFNYDNHARYRQVEGRYVEEEGFIVIEDEDNVLRLEEILEGQFF